MEQERKTNILIVDDEPHILKLIEVSLRAAGRDILTACDPEEAVRILQDRQRVAGLIDLVTTDMQMPKHDGVWLIGHFRKLGYGGPFIMVSATPPSQQDINNLRQGGPIEVLAKPFSPLKLMRLADQLLTPPGYSPRPNI